MKRHSDEATTSFEDNKKLVEKYVDAHGKKLRNVIAGYATRLKKKMITAT